MTRCLRSVAIYLEHGFSCFRRVKCSQRPWFGGRAPASPRCARRFSTAHVESQFRSCAINIRLVVFTFFTLRVAMAAGGSPPHKLGRSSDDDVLGLRPGTVSSRLFAALEQDTGPVQVSVDFPPWQPTPQQSSVAKETSLISASASVPALGGTASGEASLEAQVKSLTEMVRQLTLLQASALQASLATGHANGAAAAAATQPAQPSQAAAPQKDVDMAPEGPPDNLSKKPTVKLPAELLAKINAEGAKFWKSLKTMFRTKTYRDKLTKRLDTLAAGTMPPGCKDWKPRDDSVLWDSPIAALSADLPYSMDETTTLKEARVRLTREFYASATLVELEFVRARVAEIQEACSLQSFLDKCAVFTAPFDDALHKTMNGVTLPPGLFTSLAEPVKVEATRVHKSQVESASRQVVKD